MMTTHENTIHPSQSRLKVMRILSAPELFFSGLSDNQIFIKSFLFVSATGLFHAISSLFLLKSVNLYAMGGILFTNAVGMVFISALLSYAIARVITKKQVPFTRLFSVHAFSSGITFFISWMPPFTFFSEVWKWCLIFIGLKSACKLSGKEAFFLILLSLFIQYIMFLSFLKVTIS